MTERISETDFPELVRSIRKSLNLTQSETAERLGVIQTSISQAERDGSGSMRSLQIRIMRELAGWQIDGPFWDVRKS